MNFTCVRESPVEGPVQLVFPVSSSFVYEKDDREFFERVNVTLRA